MLICENQNFLWKYIIFSNIFSRPGWNFEKEKEREIVPRIIKWLVTRTLTWDVGDPDSRPCSESGPGLLDLLGWVSLILWNFWKAPGFVPMQYENKYQNLDIVHKTEFFLSSWSQLHAPCFENQAPYFKKIPLYVCEYNVCVWPAGSWVCAESTLQQTPSVSQNKEPKAAPPLPVYFNAKPFLTILNNVYSCPSLLGTQLSRA